MRSAYGPDNAIEHGGSRMGLFKGMKDMQEQAKQGVHPRVEPDPLLDLAELEVRLRVEADPLLDLAKHSPRRLIN